MTPHCLNLGGVRYGTARKAGTEGKLGTDTVLYLRTGTVPVPTSVGLVGGGKFPISQGW